MTPEELRLECLKLVLQSANASGIQLETSQLIVRARAYADFVMRQNGQGGADGVNSASVPKMTTEDGSRVVASEGPRLKSRVGNGSQGGMNDAA